MESLIGQIIDSYRIESIIGKGGMGTVYKATDISLDKVVALKMIDHILARDENFLRRFKTEAKALAKLENSNIVSVYTLRETNQGTFIIMEFVNAQTLSEIIRDNGVFSLEDTISISKQLLSAIGYAHKVGVLHRDIKPSNILLTENQHVKVTDFGLAKLIKSHSGESTVTQMRAGTLYYMSPEQVKGLKNVDKRSDLYSIGMTIYEMLAGRVPFEKTDSDYTIQKQIVDGEIPSPVKFNSVLPKQLGKIVLKAISTNPNKRYQSAEEMLAAINEYEKSNIKAKELLPVKQKSIHKRPIFWSLISIVTVLLVFLLFSIPDKHDKTDKEKITNSTLSKISVRTIPEYATIFLNGDSIGVSPVNNFPVTVTNFVLQIKKIGFRTVDTSLIVNKGEYNNFSFFLNKSSSLQNKSSTFAIKNDTQKESYGGLIIRTTPSGASIFLNNIFKGTTPHKYNKLKPGKYDLKISLKKYTQYNTQIIVKKNNIKTVSQTLNPLTSSNNSSESNSNVKEQESVSQIGTINIFVLPYGSIYIDDQLKQEGTNKPYKKELAVGSHVIKVMHPSFGKWEKRIKIEKDGDYHFNINFNKQYKLTVTSNQKLCYIYVDEKSIGQVTPKIIKLRTGLHSISVKKEGYELLGDEYKINIEKDVSEPIYFEMRKK